MTSFNNTTQFIYSTFKDEFSEISDKYFGFKSLNNKSFINEISKEEAFKFLHEEL